MREIGRNFNKLVKDLQSQDSPEAMAYLRIMGNELGYIKGSELNSIAASAMMYADMFMRIIPVKVVFNTAVIYLFFQQLAAVRKNLKWLFFLPGHG